MMKSEEELSILAKCLGCGRNEPLWRVRRNTTFDPQTLTFRHRSRACRPIAAIEVACSDGVSPNCRRRWVVPYRSQLEHAGSGRRKIASLTWNASNQASQVCGSCNQVRMTQANRSLESRRVGHIAWALKQVGKGHLDAKAFIERADQGDIEAEKTIKRTQQEMHRKTLGRVDPETRHAWASKGGHTKKPRTSITRIIRRSRWQDFRACPMCLLLVEKSSASMWAGCKFHAVCLKYWRRYCKQGVSTPRSFQTLPPPETWIGRPVDLKTLSRGYRSIMRRRTRGTSLRDLAEKLRTTADNVLHRERYFLQRATGTWNAMFPGSKANTSRQKVCPLPENILRKTVPVRQKSVFRLLKIGMAPYAVATHVGWHVAEVRAEAVRLGAALNPFQGSRFDAWSRVPRRRIRRRPSSGIRRIYYQRRRATGLCVDCTDRALPGRSRCERHLLGGAERMRRRRRVICRRCKRPILDGERQHGRLYHPDCFRQKERERMATPEYRARALRRVRAYQERHRQQGLCLKCPRAAMPGQVMCDRHRHPSAALVPLIRGQGASQED
jgi:hypothetical protein